MSCCCICLSVCVLQHLLAGVRARCASGQIDQRQGDALVSWFDWWMFICPVRFSADSNAPSSCLRPPIHTSLDRVYLSPELVSSIHALFLPCFSFWSAMWLAFLLAHSAWRFALRCTCVLTFVLAGCAAQVEPMEVVLRLESSSKWPDELEAVRSTGTAFLIRLAQCLERKVRRDYFF